MSLPSSIDTAFVKQYQSMLYVLSQQKKSQFVTKVRNESIQGESKCFDRLGEAEVEKITTRHPPTPNNEQPHSRRWVTPENYHTNALIDDADKLAMLINPTNEYMQNQARGLGRQIDDNIIAGALGSAAAGVTVTTASVAFKDESVSINGDGTVTTLGTLAAVTGSLADFSLGKMALMLRLFNEADVEVEIPKYWAITPKDVEDIIQIQQFASADYNTVKLLREGRIEYYLGFNLFYSNRITKDVAGSTGHRTIAWAQDGIIHASAKGIESRISDRNDLSHTNQVYSRMNGGAVRMDGDKVHECLNKVA